MKVISKYILLVSVLLSVFVNIVVAQDLKILVNDEVRSFKGLKWVPNEILVKFKNGVSKENISKLNKKNGTEILSKSKYGKFARIKVPVGKTVSSMVKIYSQNKNVIYAEPNYLATALTVPNDDQTYHALPLSFSLLKTQYNWEYFGC